MSPCVVLDAEPLAALTGPPRAPQPGGSSCVARGGPPPAGGRGPERDKFAKPMIVTTPPGKGDAEAQRGGGRLGDWGREEEDRLNSSIGSRDMRML